MSRRPQSSKASRCATASSTGPARTTRRGAIAEQVRARRFPVVGRGAGVTSFVHVADAATATVAALTRGTPGIYNVVDDEPAALRDWLPGYADAIGAKPPRRVPAWMARLFAGGFAAAMASGCAARRTRRRRPRLGWAPLLPSWREGFATRLESDPVVPGVEAPVESSTPRVRFGGSLAAP